MSFKMKLTIKDAPGFFIKFFSCTIMWYSWVLQGRFFTVNNLLLFLGLLLLIAFVVDYCSSFYRMRIAKLPLSLWLMLAYVVFSSISGVIFAVDFRSHINQSINIFENTILSLVISYYIISRKDNLFYIYNYAIMFFVMAIISIIKPVYIYSVYNSSYRYTYSLITNSNEFAMELTVGIWAILTLVSLRKIRFIFGFPAAVLLFYPIVLSGSRKGLIGAAVVFLLWLFFVYLNNYESKKTTIKLLLRVVVVLIFFFIIAYIIIPFVSDSFVWDRMINYAKEESFKSRMDMYATGIELIVVNFFGIGFQGFSYIYGLPSHSTIIEVFVSSGWLLGIVYFYNYFIIGKRLLRYRIQAKHYDNNTDITINKMMIILYILMLFYAFVVIHIFEKLSFVNFAVLISSYYINEKTN